MRNGKFSINFGFWFSVFYLAIISHGTATGLDKIYHKSSGDKTWGQYLADLVGYEGFSKSVAFIVGVSQYDYFDTLPTSKDALKMKDYLLKEAKYDVVYLLTEGKVTKERVTDLLEDEIPNLVKENDRFVFYWSGHGVTREVGSGERGYLPLSTSPRNKFGRMISMQEIKQWNGLIKAKQALYLLDSCFSGLAGSSAKNDRKITKISLLSQLSHNLFVAGNHEQQTIATDAVGGSIFTAAVLEGLRGRADATNFYPSDGVVTLSELKGYVEDRVEEMRIAAGWRKTITPQVRDLRTNDGEYYFIHPEIDNLPDKKQILISTNQKSNNAAIPKGSDLPLTQSDKPVYFYDGLSNIVRKPEDPVIAIRKNASAARRQQDSKTRRKTLGATYTEVDLSKVYERAQNVFIEIWKTSSLYTDNGIAPPKVKDINLWAYTLEGELKKPITQSLNSCAEIHRLLNFVRTHLEAQMAYKTAKSKMYGGAVTRLIDGWGRVEYPSASGIDSYGSDFPLSNRTEFGLDEILKFGVLIENYPAILFAVDLATLEWRTRISDWANLLRAYDTLLTENYPSREWVQIPEMFSIDASVLFGCKEPFDLVGWYEFERNEPNNISMFMHLHHDHEESGAGDESRSFHNSIFAFWARRDKAGTTDAVRILLDRISQDFSGVRQIEGGLLEMASENNSGYR